MIAWASGTDHPSGVMNVLIRQHCSLSVTDTHVVLTHLNQFGLQCNSAAKRQRQSASSTSLPVASEVI